MRRAAGRRWRAGSRGGRRGRAGVERVPAQRPARRRSTPSCRRIVTTTYGRAASCWSTRPSSSRVPAATTRPPRRRRPGRRRRSPAGRRFHRQDRAAEPGTAGEPRAPRVAGGPPIAVRTDFDALAVCEPSVATDAVGHATVEVAAARQPHSLPRDGRRRRRRQPVRLGRVEHHGSPAVHGAPVGATVLELRRRLRAAGDRAEPDRRDNGRRRRLADRQLLPRPMPM